MSGSEVVMWVYMAGSIVLAVAGLYALDRLETLDHSDMY